MKTLIVTGGLGFIGSNLVHFLLNKKLKKDLNKYINSNILKLRDDQIINVFENYNYFENPGSFFEKYPYFANFLT